jgi:5-dehydro-2-deoxygluconokinase
VVVSAVEELYRAGLRPDWWKLPPLSDDDAWSEISDLIHRNDPQCGGIVVLGYDKPQEKLFAAFEAALRSGSAVGFAIGRSVWREPAADWFAGQIDDAGAADLVLRQYRSVLEGWRRSDRPN